MFKKHAIQVKMVKTPKNEKASDISEDCAHVDPEKIAKISKDFVTHTAKAVGAVIVTTVVLSAISQIAVKKTKSADNED